MALYELMKILERYPLFTQNDVAKLTNKGEKYIRTMLYRLAKKSRIKRVEKGKYTMHEDAMIFASHISKPSYLGLWTAFRYYNWTQQQPFSFFLLSPVSRKRIKFDNTEMIFIKNKHMFGYKKERYGDFDIFISDKEKTIIDGLLFHLPIDDIKTGLDDEDLDFEKLAEYANRTKNHSLIKRLGYLLEKKKGNNYGLKSKDNNYITLNYLGKNKGKKDKKWKLILNT